MANRAAPVFEVRVDEETLAEDLAHASGPAQQAIGEAVKRMRVSGVGKDSLKRCAPEGRDGTRLAGCVKVYIPEPVGPWGAVFSADVQASKPVLMMVAAGERHPTKAWRPSVYEIAHRRLHG